MNYWLVVVMMVVAILIVTVLMADDAVTPSIPSPLNSSDRKEPIENGDL